MGGKQKKLVPINDNMRHPPQQTGDIGDHSYSVLHRTMMEKHIVAYHSKFKINRMDEMNTRYYNSREDTMAFFQKLETVKSEEEERKGTKLIKKKKPPDSSEESDGSPESYSHTEKVHKLNKENTEKASALFVQRSSLKPHTHESKENAEDSHSKNWKGSLPKTTGKKLAEAKAVCKKSSSDDTKSDALGVVKKHQRSEESPEKAGKDVEGTDTSRDEETEVPETTSPGEDTAEDLSSPSKSQNQDVRHKDSEKASFPPKDEQNGSSKRRVNDFGLTKEESKKSRVDAANAKDGHKPKGATKPKEAEPALPGKTNGSDSTPTKNENKQEASIGDNITIECISPPAAPFDHRIVSAKRAGIHSYYHVHKGEVLGGGRFGQVHKCEEKATGLKLAAKIIKARAAKEKVRDEVKNEINVMNHLNHVNLIQLYDAFESKHDIVLVMEYVEGGELFDRIIDENSNLSEIDTILFIKQICEGVQYMHQMYILHLDLKPENILCVNRETNQIKIIDFGLARRYKPREKLKVNFGTPEFLAPEVVNYDFVSFPTDMWSIGVIAYMLLSGLSPFLGDDDNETLNNILACRWSFDDQEFEKVSEEAKDFITKLLIKEKGWRISATAALKHPWLSDQTLHCKLQSKKKAKASAGSQAPVTP
ncbi:myosin light chain kinase family member 4 isoform X3 [Zootoca vivipara]|uniref:myosin light chain kinase family member 4 isoform X3 n=1 Tax=Zootoca vivipara TaxID=8524 RepID=UPI00293BB514|nr:myosin light chain kinase family member 4 isoform X3 [Zootoca vivipara]